MAGAVTAQLWPFQPTLTALSFPNDLRQGYGKAACLPRPIPHPTGTATVTRTFQDQGGEGVGDLDLVKAQQACGAARSHAARAPQLCPAASILRSDQAQRCSLHTRPKLSVAGT